MERQADRQTYSEREREKEREREERESNMEIYRKEDRGGNITREDRGEIEI